MKLAVYGPEERVAVLTALGMFDANHGSAAYLEKLGSGLAQVAAPAQIAKLIEAGPEALRLLEATTEWVLSERRDVLSGIADADLRAPWPGRRIAAAGGNFAEHLSAGMSRRGHAISPAEAYEAVRADEPLGYWKLPAQAVGPDGVVQYPRRCDRLDYEGEVAVIIGPGGKDIELEDAMSHVWGVTLFNDWSIRTPPKPGFFPFSLNLDKNFDGATSIGPVVAIGVVDPSALHLEVRVNGVVRQSFSTKDMIYSFAEYISFLSRDFTLLAGDLIVSGTGAGTVADTAVPDVRGELPPELFLKVGDVVEVEAAEIGILRNWIAGPADGP